MEICKSDGCLVVLYHVIPILGILTSFGIKLASWIPIQQIIKKQQLGSFDSIPNAMLCINSLSWFTYGLFIKKPYISCSGIIGVQFMLYYIMSTYHLHPQNKRDTIRKIFMIGFFIVMTVAAIAFIAIYNSEFNPTAENYLKAKTLMGTSCVLILATFYTSPLANLIEVIRTKDASSLNLYLAIALGLNGSLWTTYGVAIEDPFIYVPNSFALISCILQIIVKFTIKDKPEEPKKIEAVQFRTSQVDLM